MANTVTVNEINIVNTNNILILIALGTFEKTGALTSNTTAQ